MEWLTRAGYEETMWFLPQLNGDERELLKGHFLFQGAADAVTYASDAEDCRVEIVEKGDTIYTPREFERALGILLSGRVQVSKKGYVVSVLGPGEVFGAAALYNDRGEYATTLTALTPCRAVLLSQKLMSGVMAHDPAVAGNYIRYLSGRIRFLEGKLDSLLAPDAKRKLAQYLLERRVGDSVTLDCSMSSLARRLDLGRTSLYRAFETLTEAGAVEKKGKEIRILKEDVLL
jgi:CRP-like cAMP-binding protein